MKMRVILLTIFIIIIIILSYTYRHIVIYANIWEEWLLLKRLRISAGATSFHTFHMSSREVVRLQRRVQSSA